MDESTNLPVKLDRTVISLYTGSLVGIILIQLVLCLFIL